MARTTISIPIKKNIDINQIQLFVTQELAAKGYKEKIVKGEQVWSKGDGVIVILQNFGLVFSNSEILLQGWTGDAILGESNLDGFMGFAIKKKMKKIMNELSIKLSNMVC